MEGKHVCPHAARWRVTLCIALLLVSTHLSTALQCEHMHGCIACSESPPQAAMTAQSSTGPSTQQALERRANAMRTQPPSQEPQPSISTQGSLPITAAAQHVQAAGDLARHARGLLGVLDGVAGLVKLFNFKGKQDNASSQAMQATAAAAPAAGAAADAAGVTGSTYSNSRGHQAGLASSSVRQPSSSTARLQPQPAGSMNTNSLSQQQQQQQQQLFLQFQQQQQRLQQQQAAAGPTAQQPFTWPEAADSTAYVHSWQPASAPSLAADGSVRPPAQAFTQAPLQPLAALTTDPKDHTGPHPWDVLLFKVNQFNTTKPAYRLGGLGLMLMTDFNKSKPLTDWHVLDADAQSAQLHAVQGGGGAKPQNSVGTASFVEGHSLVKPGLANVQQPARPYSGVPAGQHAAAGAASVASTHLHQQQHQHQQHQQQRRQGSAVGVASVGGGRTGGAAQPAQVMISQGAGSSAGSGAASAGSKASSSASRFKPESMVALLTSALQRNMRMSAPGQGRDQQASDSSSSGSSGSGITEVIMEATQLWCIACEEPAYLLSTAGYCVCGPGYGRLMDASNPYSCVKCPAGHISAMNTTTKHHQQQQQQQGAQAAPQPTQTAVQTCKPCPPGQGTNEAQTACGEQGSQEVWNVVAAVASAVVISMTG